MTVILNNKEMGNTMLIQLTNQKAVRLLHELEELKLIKVLKENITSNNPKLSDKYKGIINKAEGQKLNEHIKQMRGEQYLIDTNRHLFSPHPLPFSSRRREI